MNPKPWQDLPDTPPTGPQTSSEAPTLVLERTAAGDPPPALSPQSDSLWWRTGSALALVAVLGVGAWLISERFGRAAEPESDAAPGITTTAPDGGLEPLTPGEPLPETPPTSPVVPEDTTPGPEFFFGPGDLPPEIEQFLNEDGIDLFGPGGLSPRFERFFGPDGPFSGEAPNLDELFQDRAPGSGTGGFGFSFDGELPEGFAELMQRLPELIFGGDAGSRTEVEGLINDLLADPDLPGELREFVERLADRLGVATPS